MSGTAGGTFAAIVGVVFGGFCVWLGVRIVNRRERWAKWMLAAVVAVPAVYIASFGPACWITSRTSRGTSAIGIIYKPITQALSPNDDTVISRLINWYSEIGAPVGWYWNFTRLRKKVGGKWTVLNAYEWGWEPVPSAPTVEEI